MNQLRFFEEVGVRPPRLWATGDALPHYALRVRIEADVPVTRLAAKRVTVRCFVENGGTAILTTAPPPVHLSYRCFAPGATLPLDGVESLRAPLPRSLPPRDRDSGAVTVQAPSDPSTYELRITAVRELVAWFDDVDPGSASTQTVVVEA